MSTKYTEKEWTNGIHDSPLASYAEITAPYFDSLGLQDVCSLFETTYGRPPFLLNYLGQTRVLRDLGLSGVSLSLEDNRDEKTIELDTSLGIIHIVTDVNDIQETNLELVEALSVAGRSSFDIVIARPIAGDRGFVPQNEHLLQVFMVIMEKLSKNGIFVYHGVPGKMPQSQYNLFLSQLEALSYRKITRRIRDDYIMGWMTGEAI